MRFFRVALSSALMFSAALFAGAETLQGVAALQGKTPKTDGHLTVTPVNGKPLTEKLDFWLTEPGTPKVVKGYETEMTKKMHVIIVSNDFKLFLHEHPALNPKTGHLILTQTFPQPGTYQIYSDGIPDGMTDHQVFRYQLVVGHPSSDVRILPPSGLSATAGPYEVDLSTVRLQSRTPGTHIDIQILKDGKPATDLHPYLGGEAHAVFLNSQDLSYVHAHPMPTGMKMDMSKPMPDIPEGARIDPNMSCYMPLYEPGKYKLWLQFKGGTQLYIAEFDITVN